MELCELKEPLVIISFESVFLQEYGDPINKCLYDYLFGKFETLEIKEEPGILQQISRCETAKIHILMESLTHHETDLKMQWLFHRCPTLDPLQLFVLAKRNETLKLNALQFITERQGLFPKEAAFIDGDANLCERARKLRTFITYTLPGESGSTPRAVGFHEDGIVPASPRGWDCESRPRTVADKYPVGEKLRWKLTVD